MDLMMFKEVILTAEETQFLKDTEDLGSRPRSEAGLISRRVMIEMYSIKHAEANTHRLINSNKELAASTDKHAEAMRRLTTALVIVAGLQVIVAIIVAIIPIIYQ